jgi:hypothetical protein
VTQLLDALELHTEMLHIGHEDARRLALRGQRPGYLLDFELIFRYAFRADERPDWAQELEYLLNHEQTTFLIGPGTKLELDQFIDNVGFAARRDGTIETKRRSRRRASKDYGLDEGTLKFGIHRLHELLSHRNVRQWEGLTDPNIDDEAFETAKAALDARRRGVGATESNRADALNWAAVLYLRQHAAAADVAFNPYLLTATKPLLNERGWSREIVGPVSRRPADAIYVEVLLDTFPNSAEAVDHTIEVAYQAACLQRDLRKTPAYLNPQEHKSDPEFASAIEENLITDDLRAQLRDLSEFITDPVVTTTQRIYDNANLAAASITQQRGEILPSLTRSPRKLFDLIVEVNAALGARDQASGLGDLWNRALDLRTHRQAGHVTYELVDRQAGKRPLQYLVVERYQPVKDAPEGLSDEQPDGTQFVLRWPSALDAEEVLELFCTAFARHATATVEMAVGTERGVERLGAELPITLAQLMEAIRDDDRADGEALPQLHWIRMGSSDFDLYADVSPPGIAAEPVVGVFAEQLNPEHVQELYDQTSARYLFPAWLRRAIDAILTDSD